jgi:hypothetical protein
VIQCAPGGGSRCCFSRRSNILSTLENKETKMRLNKGRKTRLFMIGLALLCLAGHSASNAQMPLPNPVLVLTGQEFFQTGGKSFIRYNYFVDNATAFPNTLFAASPNLPPCGNNTKASRTWADFYDSRGKRLYGFCSLGKSADLNKLWFALESDVIPPSWVYIELTDRSTNTKYKSNLAETTP